MDIQSGWNDVREFGSNERKWYGGSLCRRSSASLSSVQGHVEERFMVQSNDCGISITVTRLQWRYL